jgi:hypothetical protein
VEEAAVKEDDGVDIAGSQLQVSGSDLTADIRHVLG